MEISIFKKSEKSSFAKKSRSMARILALGACSLALSFCLFMVFYFPSSELTRILSIFLPITYLIIYFVGFSKISNKLLYRIIFFNFILTSLVLLFIAYQFSFNSEYMILMLVVYNIILVALPTPKQVFTFFGIIFTLLLITLLFSDISIGFSLLITVSFGYVFALSYLISKQKKSLNQRNHQNTEILKALVNNTNDSIFLVDYFSNEIKDANERTKKVFGLEDVNELLSEKYYQLFADEEFIPSNRNEIVQAITQYGFFQKEALFKRKDGSQFLGYLHLSPFKAVRNNYYLIQIKDVDSKS